jgi:hypothetical protein
MTPLVSKKGMPTGRPQPPQKFASEELTKPQCVQAFGA